MKKLFLWVLLVSVVLLANDAESNTSKTNILSDEGSFYGLKVEAEDAFVDVFFNGMLVYRDWSGTESNSFTPINPYITTGKNELKVKLFGDNLKINQLSKCKVQLYYINEKYNMKQVLTTLAFDNAKAKEKLKGSSRAGEINAIVHEYAPVGISEVEVKDKIMISGKVGGTSLTQYISLATPFPRWKFLDSELIAEKPFNEMMSDSSYEDFKNSPQMTALYALQKELEDAILRKDIESIKPLFEERNKEMDIAYQGEKGDTAKELFYNLEKDANDEKLELYLYKKGKQPYIIEDNNRVGYINKAIIFNRKDKSGSETYHMKCRYEKGRWIITR